MDAFCLRRWPRPHPEPADTVFTFFVVLVILVGVVLGILLQFRKNPFVAVVGLIMVLAVIAVVVFVFVRLIFWKNKAISNRLFCSSAFLSESLLLFPTPLF